MIGDVGGGSGLQLWRDRVDGPGSETLDEEEGYSWGEIETMAQDRRRWKRKWVTAGVKKRRWPRIGDVVELLLAVYALV